MASLPAGVAMRIKDKSSRVKLCSLKDFADKDENYHFYRQGIYEAWANIKAVKASRFNRDGYVVNERGDNVSHIITMKYRPDIEITDAAWIYHMRQLSAPIWYRIVQVSEDSNCFKFLCRLFEKGDNALAPLEKAPSGFTPVPMGDVRL